MTMSEYAISKFLTLVLRHKPETIGISLDDAGWADVDELLDACRRHQIVVSRSQLEAVVANNEKRRFAFSHDKKRIRANQGHSIPVNLGYVPVEPPAVLYHGTATKFLMSIRQKGLIKRSRIHVHLSADSQTAMSVGRRHGEPVVIQVNAALMFADGHKFYQAANGVWLTDEVPAKYLEIPAMGAISTNGRPGAASLVARGRLQDAQES